MQEELTFDRPLTDHQQEALVRRHCHGLEARIRSAGSKDEAEKVVEEMCRRFDRDCESRIVRAFLRKYVHSLFKEVWNR